MKITGQQVRDAVTAKGITRIEHHGCALCGAGVFYSVEGDQLYFNSGCDCSWSPPQPRSWDSAADWINMQSKPEVGAKIAALFGVE